MFAHTHVMIDFPLNLKPSNHPKTTVYEFRWAKKSHVFNVMPMQMFQLPAIIIQSNLRPMSDKCGTNWIFKMTRDSYSDRQSKLHEFQFTKWTIKHQQFPKLRFLTLWYVTTETSVQLVFRSTLAVCAVHTFGLLVIFDRAGWFFILQSVIVQWQ